MSEVKVNKISPRTNCGTVQLGDSGDTITIPAGASITNNGTASGFGATGSASWNTTVKTGDFTAVAGEGYFVNTTSGEVDVTLPAGTAGAVVAVKDYAKTWDTNSCVIISNGSEKIGGSTNNAILSTEGLAVTFVYIDSTQGWLVTDDGLQSVADTNPYMQATGGTETESGNCKIHTFTGPGTFTVNKLALSAPNNQVSYMVVAGGGGGGGGGGPSGFSGAAGAGGGAGGFREDKSPITPYTASPLEGAGAITVTATSFPITVGGGGAGAPPNPGCATGSSGNSSVFSTITSAGGGGGANNVAGGVNGGSGGGAGQGQSAGSGNTPPVSPAQGQDGGGPSGPNNSGGGGGGATQAGQVGTAAGGPGTGGIGGAGGTGATTNITGSPVGYAGGGGGGAGGDIPVGPSGPGGPASDGGGAGGVAGQPGNDGTANRGGGAGAGGANPGKTGSAGGSGIVVIRYRYQ
jgi:hypothetical protein